MASKKLTYFILIVLSACFSVAWFSPAPKTSFIASRDVIAVSSDSHSVGTSGNYWQNTYQRNAYLKYRAEAPSTIASYGTVWASTDGHVYFTNAAGTSTKLS